MAGSTILEPHLATLNSGVAASRQSAAIRRRASQRRSAETPLQVEVHRKRLFHMNSGRNMNGMTTLAFMLRPELMWRFTGSDKSVGAWQAARHVSLAALSIQ